jgi:hypothetical protein
MKGFIITREVIDGTKLDGSKRPRASLTPQDPFNQ